MIRDLQKFDPSLMLKTLWDPKTKYLLQFFQKFENNGIWSAFSSITILYALQGKLELFFRAMHTIHHISAISNFKWKHSQ